MPRGGDKRKSSDTSPLHQKSQKAQKESTSPHHSPPNTRTMSKNSTETWSKALQKDVQRLATRTWDLEKTVNRLQAENDNKDHRIALLEEAIINTNRQDILRKIDEESQTLMLTGFKIPQHPRTERAAALQTHLQNTLPDLSNDIREHGPEISFNGPDARNPTAFLKFPTRKGAFSTAKNFSTSDRKRHSLRSCIPKEVREKRDKIVKDFKDDPANNGWVCQLSLGKGHDRDQFLCRRAKDPGNGSRPTNWVDHTKHKAHKEYKPRPVEHVDDPPQLTMESSLLEGRITK